MSQHLEGLNLVELLNLLHPPAVPERIDMTPQTPGWIILAIALVLLLGWGFALILRRYRSNAYRRAALAELTYLSRTGNDPAEIAVLLKRTALAAFPRDQVASLHGESWLTFLDAHFPGEGFCHGAGRVLATAPWRPAAADPALSALARDWIRRHHIDTEPKC
jgi:hypothetical protein